MSHDVNIEDVATFDTETMGGLGGFFKCGVCYLDRECHKYENPTNMRCFILAHPEKVWYAHNLHFDIGKMWCTNEIIPFEKLVVHGKIIMMKVPAPTGIVELRDSSALMPTRLEKLGAKGDTPLALLDKPNPTPEEWEEIYGYCEQDCKVLYDAIVNFQGIFSKIRNDVRVGKKRSRIAPLKLTVSTQMLSIFKTKVKLTYWDKDNKKNVLKSVISRQNEASEASYYGGRTENNIIGVVHGTFTYWDINSMYPHAGCWPIPDPATMKYYDIGKWKPWYHDTFKGEEGVANITCCEQHPYPFLATREKGRVIFRNGAKEGWYTLTDIRYGMSIGSLSNVQYKEVWATPYTISFKDIFEKLYDERLKAPMEGMAEILKVLMNGGYGKFGETVPVEDTYKTYDNFWQWNKAMKEYGDNVVWFDDERYMLQIKAEEELPTDHTAFIIASYITSRARVVLHEYIMQLHNAGYRVLYMDTDSLVTDAPEGFFKNSTTLGDMKMEGVLSGLWVMAPKCYMMRYVKKLNKKTKNYDTVQFDDFKHKGVKLRDGVEKRIRDTVSAEMQLGLWKYLSAMRYGKQMFDEKELSDRHHSFEHQKRYYSGDIKPADQYYAVFKANGTDFMDTRPYNDEHEHNENVRHLTEEDKIAIIERSKKLIGLRSRTRAGKYMPQKFKILRDDDDWSKDKKKRLSVGERYKKTEIEKILHNEE